MFDQGTLEPWLIYPLQVFNVFEIIYWIALAYFLSKGLPELDMDRSMMVVMSSYGTPASFLYGPGGALIRQYKGVVKMETVLKDLEEASH
jgi:hypothetical protein